MSRELIPLQCDSIAQSLHGARRAIDQLLFVISDLSEDEPSCSINGPRGHVENASRRRRQR